MKDNLIDEEKAKQEEAAQESLEQKIDRLGTRFIFSTQLHQAINYFFNLADFTMENMSARFSRLIAEYSSFQAKVKQRLAKLEVESIPK